MGKAYLKANRLCSRRLNQAIEQSAEILSNVKFVQEKKVIKKYFDEIAQDTGKICFGG